LPKNLPSRATATWTTGTAVIYPGGISAADAYAAMSRAPAMESPDCATVPPLQITSARLGTYDFATDRGKAQMTSWLFTASATNGEIAYPALMPGAFWKGGLVSQSGNGGAGVSTDGRSLVWGFAGTPSVAGPCGADYKGVVAESPSAVAVALQVIPHASPGDLVACPAIAQERTVTVSLASPLGGRVVVDASGYPVTVCPVALQRAC